MSFQAKLLYLIAWILRTPQQQLTSSTDLRRDLGLDATDFDLMIFQLENYYHTTFTDDQINQIVTVQDIDRLLRKQSASQMEIAYS